MEVDFHHGPQDCDEIQYCDAMAEVREEALEALKKAHNQGIRYVLFTHGHSTSQGFSHTTARSQVRGLMRSRDATRYITRKECIQLRSVFVAAIRLNPRAP